MNLHADGRCSGVGSHRRHAWRLPGALVVLALCAACAIPPQHLDRLVLVHADGYAMSQTRERIVPLKTSPAQAVEVFKTGWGNQTLSAIDKYAATLKPDAPLRLLLYVHGGLNTYKRGMDRVATMLEAVRTRKDKDNRQLAALPRYYPIFINWNSDLWGSIYDDVFELRFGERQTVAGYFSAVPEGGARMAQGILGAPSSLGLEVAGIRNGLNVKPDDRDWPYCHTPSLGNPSNDRRWWNAFIFTLFYPTRVLTASAIQGFGAPAWDTMKRRAELVVAPPGQVTKTDPSESGGGSLFVKTLQERVRRIGKDVFWTWIDSSGQARQVPVEITAVGHSMGTMVLNHLLETLPDFPIRRILYLAAADSIHDVYDAIVPYLARHPDAEFWSFSLAETNEALEVDIVDVIPRGSLLVWIDHFFQRVNAPSDRTFGRASNLRQYVQVPPGLSGGPGERQRFFLVKFGRTKRDPSRHGDLGNVWYLDMALQTVESGVCQR